MVLNLSPYYRMFPNVVVQCLFVPQWQVMTMWATVVTKVFLINGNFGERKMVWLSHHMPPEGGDSSTAL
jgi:hypothetical protein